MRLREPDALLPAARAECQIQAMSLTSFLQNQDVKQRFRQEFAMPKMAVKREVLAPPLSTRYSLVGTAFDYLLRFYLKRLNPEAVTKRWVAELVLASPFSPLLQDVVFDLSSGKVVRFRETELTRKAQWIIEQAKADYADYLSSGQMTDRLIESALRLAQLDPIIRAGVIDEDLGNVHREDVDDLRQLISLVEPQLFKASRLCLLNPTFGEASLLVGGADADLVLDDTIIDVKTTKNLRLERGHFDQLIGYFVLHEIAGVGGLTPRPAITKVGVYFSRFGYLYTIDLSSIIHPETFPGFVEWFIARARQEFPIYQLASTGCPPGPPTSPHSLRPGSLPRDRTAGGIHGQQRKSLRRPRRGRSNPLRPWGLLQALCTLAAATARWLAGKKP